MVKYISFLLFIFVSINSYAIVPTSVEVGDSCLEISQVEKDDCHTESNGEPENTEHRDECECHCHIHCAAPLFVIRESLFSAESNLLAVNSYPSILKQNIATFHNKLKRPPIS